MKLYIFKNGNLYVRKETTTQSVISDLFTYGYTVVVFACGIAFNILVGNSFLINFAIVALITLWFLGNFGKQKKEVSKDELKQIIEEL